MVYNRDYYIYFLDKLPFELLYKVFKLLKIEELIQLFESVTFLDTNNNVQKALKYRLKESNLTYNNRLIVPSLIEIYLRIPSFYDKSTIEFLKAPSHLSTLIDFTLKHEEIYLNNPISLCFYIWGIIDLENCIKIITSLPPSNVRYNIELEFDPGILYLIDLNVIFEERLFNLRNYISSISIYNYSGNLLLDLLKFPNLINFDCHNSNVQIISPIAESKSVKSLVIFPNLNGYNTNKPIHISASLPLGILYLELGNCIFKEDSIPYLFPENVKSIKLKNVKHLTNPMFTKELILKNIVSLTDLEIEYNLNNGIDENFIEQLLTKAENLDYLGLSNISADLNLDFSDSLLKRLRISQSNVPFFKSGVYLTDLNLSNNKINDLNSIKLLESLRMLDLSDNPIDWERKVFFPSKLKMLKLTNTGIGNNLSKLEFPDSIEFLSLEVNEITSVDYIKFPEGIKILGLGSNKIKTISALLLPVKCELLILTENSLRGRIDFSKNYWGEELYLKYLYLNYNNFSNLNDIIFPQGLKVVNLDNCKFKVLENINFQKSLEEISISGCEIDRLKNITFEDDSQLVFISLSQNNIRILDKESCVLPNSLDSINLGGNKLQKIEKSFFKNLENLKSLNLSNNRLKRVSLELFISLEILELSFNYIKSINLQFPKQCETNLTILNLSSNLLDKLATNMIGLNDDGVKHTRLIEIDITDNKISPDLISGMLKSFPKTLRYVMFGHTGHQDVFGYNIGCNIINNDLCSMKRIDVPYH